MSVTFSRFREGAAERRFWLREGQTLTVGKSDRADYCLPTDADLEDVHFQVSFQSGKCLIQCLGDQPEGLWVNGEAVVASELHHCDLVQIGASQFRIAMDGETVREAILPERSATSSSRKASRRTYASGIVELKMEEGPIDLTAAVQTLMRAGRGYVVLNFKRAGAPERIAQEQSEDLFCNAPDEVRNAESLQLVEFEDALVAVTLLNEPAVADAAMLLFTTQPHEQLLSDHQRYWAWLAAPSILTLQVTRGSAGLAAAIFRGVEAVLVGGGQTGTFPTIFTRSDRANDLQSLLLGGAGIDASRANFPSRTFQ